MKLCFFAGANSIHAIRWIAFFANKGHEVSWISLAPAIKEASELIPKVSFYEIQPSPLSDVNGRFAPRHIPSTIRRVRTILDALKPNILHIHSAGTYGFIGSFAQFHPTVLTPWGSDILLASPLRKPFLKHTIRQADIYTCDGENTLEKLVSFGASRQKIHLIRFGTDVEKFKPHDRKQAEEKTRIISLRSLEPIYSIETLLHAIAIVVSIIPTVECVIAGDGSQKKYLQNLSQSLGIEKHVQFVGKIHNERLPEIIRSADIYVSTSLSDSGLAASTAESMACGLPIITTDSGDNRTWIHEGIGGFVTPLRDDRALAEKIIFFCLNHQERNSFGLYNRKIIEEKNNYYKEMTKVEELYRACL